MTKRYSDIVGEVRRPPIKPGYPRLTYHVLKCGHTALIRDPQSTSEAISQGFRKKRLCRTCTFIGADE